MGYLLEVTSVNNPVVMMYGTKLYGYLEDEEFDTLYSVHYLIGIGKIKYEERLFYNVWWGCPEEIRLTAQEYRCFIILYIQDYKGSIAPEYRDRDGTEIFGENFDDLFNSEDDKILTWG